MKFVNGKKAINGTPVEVQDAGKVWKVGGPMSLKYFSCSTLSSDESSRVFSAVMDPAVAQNIGGVKSRPHRLRLAVLIGSFGL
jgi:hypothetical protein